MFARTMTILRGKNPDFKYIPMFVAEAIGTGMLLFFGCMGCLIQNDTTPHFWGGLNFGLSVMTIIQVFGHLSGSHLNSCVTLGSLLLGYIKPVMAVVYILAQFAGAVLGFGLLRLLVDDVKPGFCMTVLKDNVSVVQGFFLELVISTVLVFVCCAVWDPRNAHKSDSVPLRFGLVISLLAMVVGPYTGASMNTQRSFAPAIWGESWKDQWIFFVAPNLGSFVAVGIYRFFFPIIEATDEDKEEKA